MTLLPIPPDPEPSAAEIEAQVRTQSGMPERLRLRMAVHNWRMEKLQTDPNAFLVCFATNIRQFPGGGHDYEIYQQSSLWKRIRRKVLKYAEHRCAGCLEKATEVHHRDYRPRVLAGDDLSPLVALCHKCHHQVHNNEQGRRRDDWSACEQVLAVMVSRTS